MGKTKMMNAGLGMLSSLLAMALASVLLAACGGGDHEVDCGNGRPLYGDQQAAWDAQCPNRPADAGK